MLFYHRIGVLLVIGKIFDNKINQILCDAIKDNYDYLEGMNKL